MWNTGLDEAQAGIKIAGRNINNLWYADDISLVAESKEELSSGYPYFIQFKSEFGNKEFMIWATVSSRSCFCWLNRASPSLAAKNIINLISVLT